MSDARAIAFDMLRRVPEVPVRIQAEAPTGVHRPRHAHARTRAAAKAIRAPISPITFAISLVSTLALLYVCLIATVMSYGAATVGFAQSVRDDEAAVASLESRYLASVNELTTTDYKALGYTKPVSETFVPKAPVTALR